MRQYPTGPLAGVVKTASPAGCSGGEGQAGVMTIYDKKMDLPESGSSGIL